VCFAICEKHRKRVFTFLRYASSMAKPSFSTDPCKVDEQGRTIIPKDVRQALGIAGEKAHIVYEVDGEAVRLRRVAWTPL
jgi:AbrB family looped-hinge helix DNA binding protein